MANKIDNSPARSSINSLITALCIGAVPHILYQPFWVGLLFVAMLSWRLLHQYRGWPLPVNSRGLRVVHTALAILTIGLLFSQFGLTIGLHAGAALLTIMLAFKVVEIRSLRDYYLCSFLGYFLVITNFFYNQTIWMMILMLIVVMLLTSCLLSVNVQSVSHKKRLKTAGIMVLQALPLMLFLFILFPRISGPLWGLPQDAAGDAPASMTEQITLGELPATDASQGTTGASDRIEMGKISQLIQSDALAFRVRFDNTIPPAHALYWRGPVLWHTDGTVWSPLAEPAAQPPVIEGRGQAVDYSITLEPHQRHWLFALDLPTGNAQGVANHFSSDGRLDSDKKITKRTQYSLQSQPEYRFNAEREDNLSAALQLPAGKHPKTRELAQQWRAQQDSDEAYINAVLNYFSQQAFYYTLTPPHLRGDTIDTFLFESRRGFCEHYAASFTVLMRAGGIPARIVTGYQGGDVNPVDQVLTVRQRDAHAWTEVWLPHQGWRRIDPTAAVASSRIENGIAGLLPTNRTSPALIAQNDRLTALWQQAKNRWSAFNNSWDFWVVSFTPERQLQLLSLLGMQNPSWQKMLFWLVALFIATGLTLLAASYYRRPNPDPVMRAYQQFCNKLAAAGLNRHGHEGPYDFARRASQHWPERYVAIESITQLYAQLRYRQFDAEQLQQLQQQVQRFRPMRRRFAKATSNQGK